MNISAQIVSYLLKNPPQIEADILRAKRKFCKTSKIKNVPSNSELLKKYRKQTKKNEPLANLLRKRSVRTMSGIAPIAVLTKPHPCPGSCAYCPKEKNMPTSYLSNEPAVMRAILCEFNPYKQVQMRLRALQNNGHATDKIELIVMGGTWSSLPDNYQLWYVSECFRGTSDFPETKNNKQLTSTIRRSQPKNKNLFKKELIKEQKRNEKAKNRIIGLTLETRPDCISIKELQKMRALGATRIEIGIQHLDNKILKLNKRGHTVQQTIKATGLMRQFGFKITYHIMLNLPGATQAKDFAMCQKIFTDPKFQPDQIKLYPCVVAKGSTLYHWWQQGQWQSYSTKTLTNLLVKIKSITPPWVRIIRVIRDIPKESIIAGNKITNLRQTVQAQMKKQKINCQCIRCREAGHQQQFPISKSKFASGKFDQFPNKFKIPNLKFIKRKYETVNNGMEYFLSYESRDQKILYAFCRLFLPNPNDKIITDYGLQITDYRLRITDYALVRELHTYGQMVPIGQSGKIQHQGLGKKLLLEAEKIAKKHGYQKIAVIAGIGVREYYRKLGYKLQNTYMIKNI
ncbi:hypothetical protein AUJ29_02065 [Candidatus Kuenenbacteria bacterium CG1_02_38_13]|uniref:tRNA carboxymethyluridine synthase n=3 Tax=Candidatus Kueneniibacteriota TaxID=1752740 RepID=A0A1J4TZ42_9BACT|nr:MAG: hypothetical protein AUJ29_02065 [Candidatus Kuenenbacteria bacterium CG1_02_38_13]